MEHCLTLLPRDTVYSNEKDADGVKFLCPCRDDEDFISLPRKKMPTTSTQLLRTLQVVRTPAGQKKLTGSVNIGPPEGIKKCGRIETSTERE